MLKKSILAALLFALWSISGVSNALTSPPSGQPTTFLGPILHLNRYDTLTENTGFALLGEAGLKNWRVGGTMGWVLNPHQRVKLSAEYLLQDITYSFFSGNTNQWVSQAALGLAYQADLDMQSPWETQFNVSGFLSHAPSKNLSNATGTYLNDGVITNYTNLRRIAGSDATGVAPGISARPWQGGKVTLDANYDSVRYDTIYTQNQNAKGLGATLGLSQALVHNLDFNALASVRAPFNQYEADVGWTTNTHLGEWRFGVGSDYVIGKNTLPSTYTLTLSANYLPNQPKAKHALTQHAETRFIDWIASPAVYLPQVLAIPDEMVGNCLNPPTVIDMIGDSLPGGGIGIEGAFTLNLAVIFAGNDLSYTIHYNGQPNNGSLTIVNGSLVGNNNYPGGQYTNVSVTAHNACGSVTSNLFNAVHT